MSSNLILLLHNVEIRRVHGWVRGARVRGGGGPVGVVSWPARGPPKAGLAASAYYNNEY